MKDAQLAIVGAGPIGLELAIACKRAGIDYLHFDRGQIAETISWFPPLMRFFSSNERIALAGVPIQTADQSKCTREEYLAYLRTLVVQFDLAVRTYEQVVSIDGTRSGFELRTRARGAEHVHRVVNVVLATGGTARPRRLGIPGEDLPHVRHSLGDPHRYFQRRLLVVGGRNSAAEAALRAHHVFADVALSYRGEAFDPRSIKYWLLPELEGYIKQQEIRCYFRTQPQEITPTDVTLKQLDSGDLEHLPVDDVLVLIGFTADMSLFETAGVQLQGEDRVPAFDEQTMETDVPGIYVAGTAVAGTQQSYQVFLENCHIHVDRIVAAITGAVPPAAPPPNPELEA